MERKPVDRARQWQVGLSRRWRWLLIALGTAGILAWLIRWGHPLLRLFGDAQRVRHFVASFGPWPPVTLIALQIIQVVVAFVPGGVINLASGYLFGPVWGTCYSMIGLVGGTMAALGLSRRFGRPLVERLVSASTLERLDRYAHDRGAVFFLLAFLIPFSPSDAACFVAGLTPLPLRQLILIALIGRMPGVLLANLMGAGAATLALPRLLPMVVPLLLAALALWRLRGRIADALLVILARLEKPARR